MKPATQSAAVLFGAFLALGSGLVLLPRAALAANASAPYTNVNPRNDSGNDTGDSRVDGLNQRQLNENYWREAQRPGGVPNPPYHAP